MLLITLILFVAGIIGMFVAVQNSLTGLMFILFMMTCGAVYPLLAVALYIRFAPTIGDFWQWRSERRNQSATKKQRRTRRRPQQQSELGDF